MVKIFESYTKVGQVGFSLQDDKQMDRENISEGKSCIRVYKGKSGFRVYRGSQAL